MAIELYSVGDLKIEALCRRPPGGQHVDVETGVRITHIPTGLVAECDAARSQHRNRLIAMDMIMGGITSPHYR
jgi:peptide chain release factor 2